MDYTNQLKSPLWQKKRLEIMQRDDFQCQQCGSKSKTLNVHHYYYADGLKAWEYPNEALITLCEECHTFEDYKYREQIAELITTLKVICIPSWIVELLNNALSQYINDPIGAQRFINNMFKAAVKDKNIINKEEFIKQVKSIKQCHVSAQ